MPPSKPFRWMTVTKAAERLGVSKNSVYRWLRETTPEQIPRRRQRLPDPGGKLRQTLAVDYNALHDYSLTL